MVSLYSYIASSTPAYIAFTDAAIISGDAGKNQVASNVENTVCDVMRLIGRRFSDAEVQSDVKQHWLFEVVNVGDNRPAIAVEYQHEKRTFMPEEIAAMVCVGLGVFVCADAWCRCC